MLKTHIAKKQNLKPKWHLIDASNKVLGRLATQVSSLLIGKANPEFSSNVNVGDKVVVINVSKIKVTGRKLISKKYYWHSNYPGGLREENLESLLSRSPETVLKRAVSGMLPVNKLRDKRLLNLHIYRGNEHKHEAQLGK